MADWMERTSDRQTHRIHEMAMHKRLAAVHTPLRVPVSRRELIVCAKIHDMRTVALWQVLMPLARGIENVRVATYPDQGYEQITIWFAEASLETLEPVAVRLRGMSWVADTVLRWVLVQTVGEAETFAIHKDALFIE
jgi:hypothetical protein